MRNWSINLEIDEYTEDPAFIIRDAIQAISDTEPGCYVNLAVAPNHGNPDNYLTPSLVDVFGDSIAIRFIDQCGCGGYVYRVVRKS